MEADLVIPTTPNLVAVYRLCPDCGMRLAIDEMFIINPPVDFDFRIA